MGPCPRAQAFSGAFFPTCRGQPIMWMQDLLEEMDLATREIGALRWSVPLTTPRMMAEMLREPKAATRMYRRGVEAGAGQLVRLMVEYAGSPVARLEALEREADRLRGWYLFEETDTGWSLPTDLAVAMGDNAATERFFAGTLLRRLSVQDLRDLLAERELPMHGSSAAQVARLRDSLVEDTDLDDAVDAATETERLQEIEAEMIDQVRAVPGFAGRVLEVIIDGESFKLAPREVAERLGHQFGGVEVTAATKTRVRKPQKLDLPTFVRAGAFVTFSTARFADEALKHDEFQELVLHRLDERRCVTVAGCSAADAIRLLKDLGFHTSSDPGANA